MAEGAILIKTMAKLIMKKVPAITNKMFFIAEVDSVDTPTKTVGIIRYGASIPDEQLYRRGFGFEPTVGDEVLCLNLGGSVLVLCAIGVDAAGAVAAEDVSYDDTGNILLNGADVQAALDDADALFQSMFTAINDVVSDLSAHETDTTDAHDASAVSFDGTGLAALSVPDDVQDALEFADAALVILGDLIEDVETDLAAHLADTVGAHNASAISYDDSTNDYIDGATVQLALDDADQEINDVIADLDSHITDAVDAHDASAISIVDSGSYYTGTQVEAALQEIGDALTYTGQVILTPGDFVAGQGTPALTNYLTTAADATGYTGWALDGATDEGIKTEFRLPGDWLSAHITSVSVRFFLAVAAGAGQDVRMGPGLTYITVGDVLTASGNNHAEVLVNTSVASGAQYTVYEVTYFGAGIEPVNALAANDTIALTILRRGGQAADDYNSDIVVFDVTVNYSARRA